MRASLAHGILMVILLLLVSLQASCAPYTITITADVTSAQGVSAQAQACLTALDLPNSVSLSEAKACVDGTLVRVDSLVASTSSQHFEIGRAHV